MRPGSPIALACALLVLTPLSSGAAIELPDDFAHEIVVSGLSQPNSMAFLPDGRVLITEQVTGRVRMVVDGQIAPTPVLQITDHRAFFSEQGLQGIAVDPGWPDRPFVYLFYNRLHTGSPPGMCRIVRYTASGDLAQPLGTSLTLTTPLLLIDDIPDWTQYHQAGCLRFGPDGYLYASLGDDDENPCLAADSTSQRGQIVRLDVSMLPPGPGGPVPRSLITPPDNPLVTTDPNAKLVWVYGVRNPWRFDIDPVTGKLYVADVGEADYEEFTEAGAGDFLGWPWREGFLIMPRPPCSEPGGEGSAPFKTPLATFPNGEGLTAVFPGGVYRPVPGASHNWPAAYHGNAFYGEYYSGFYRRLVKSAGEWEPATPVPGQPSAADWGTGFTSAVDFQVGPDGSMWWLRQFDDDFSANSGSLQRIRYTSLVDVPAAPGSAVALLGRPNPFTSSVEIAFRLETEGRVRLAIHDVGGRRIRTLQDGVAGAGPHRIGWDGRDGEGRALAPGVYLARLVHPGGASTVRLLRLEGR